MLKGLQQEFLWGNGSINCARCVPGFNVKSLSISLSNKPNYGRYIALSILVYIV